MRHKEVVADMVFDYEVEARRLAVPPERLKEIVAETRQEFAGDEMMVEIHVLRAVRAEARQNPTVLQQ